MDNYLEHYGTKRHSGRYPWGSGDNPYQRTTGFFSRLYDLRGQGLSEAEVAKAMFGEDATTTQLRAHITMNKQELTQLRINTAVKLHDKGYSNSAIGARMGISEGAVRKYLKDETKRRNQILTETADNLQSIVDEKGVVDIGKGVEYQAGISRTKFDNAVAILKEKGYQVHNVWVKQMGTNHETTVKVLAKPDVEWKDVMKDPGQIHTIGGVVDTSDGKTRLGLKPITDISSKRVKVCYAEDGGLEKDGLIEIRPGCEDLNMGSARYMQVRISVDGTHYLKGMAVYNDNLPKGVDILFNTNKHKGTPMIGEDKDHSVLKPQKDDPDNPFGATVHQREYVGKDGKTHTSALNVVREEGEWTLWSKNLPSQMLSKQRPALAKKQLDKAYDESRKELDEILALNNPTVKKKLLQTYADGADADAIHLKAAAMPRQGYHVIIPMPQLKPNEIYAPNYDNGEHVVAIRYPHGGLFEIPELIVNNKNPQAKKILGTAKDAVGINAKVAEQLSGADFDGDTVMVIPNNNGAIKTMKPLKDLATFDPKAAYPGYTGMKRMANTQNEMGKISNLITDMTIQGADTSELARAVRHSMVVIDAEKHNLDYKRSERENNIADLKKRYQKGGGAATLISKAKSPLVIDERKEITDVKKMTPSEKKLWDNGEKVYRNTEGTHIVRKKNATTGEWETKGTAPNKQRSTKMAEAKDASALSSGTKMEQIYADYANGMKDLAKEARRAYRTTERLQYSPTAKKTYSKEVSDLKTKLDYAKQFTPIERQAQIYANSILQAKTQEDPSIREDKERLTKVKNQCLAEARSRVGAKSRKETNVVITDKEWQAIQAGAISDSMLREIMDHTDLDKLRELATPRQHTVVSDATKNRIKTLLASGATQAEVANLVGVSTSTVNKVAND